LPIEIVGAAQQTAARQAAPGKSEPGPMPSPPAIEPSEESRPINLDAEDLLRELDGYAERRNPMLSALIKSACRVELTAGALVLYYAPEHSFHKSQLETQYRELVEGLLTEKAGRALGLTCRIEQQPLAAVPPLRSVPAVAGPAPPSGGRAEEAAGDAALDPAEEVRQAFRGEYVEDETYSGDDPGD
jgi:hypothetical protein